MIEPNDNSQANPEPQLSLFRRLIEVRRIKSELLKMLKSPNPLAPKTLEKLLSTQLACEVARDYIVEVGYYRFEDKCYQKCSFADRLVKTHPGSAKELVESRLMPMLSRQVKGHVLFGLFISECKDCISQQLLKEVGVVDLLYPDNNLTTKATGYNALRGAADMGSPEISEWVCQLALNAFKQGDVRVAEEIQVAQRWANANAKNTQQPDFIRSAQVFKKAGEEMAGYTRDQVEQKNRASKMIESGVSVSAALASDAPPMAAPSAEQKGSSVTGAKSDEVEELKAMNASLLKQLQRVLHENDALKAANTSLEEALKEKSLDQKGLSSAEERPSKISPLSLETFRQQKASVGTSSVASEDRSKPMSKG